MAPWVGVGGICLAVGREWENFMAISLHEPEITLVLVFSSLSSCFAVGREWENYMALSLHDPEITLSLFIFVSFVLRWEESGRTIWLYLCMNLKSLFVFSSLSPVM